MMKTIPKKTEKIAGETCIEIGDQISVVKKETKEKAKMVESCIVKKQITSTGR